MSIRYILFRVVLYTSFAVTLYVFYATVYLHPCERPQTYSIGEIFPASAIEPWQLEELLWGVEDMWEQASGLQLFRYQKTGGDITVNIILNNDSKIVSSGESFDKGSHYRGEINIYHFDSQADLIKVLAHEFGHALNLGHVAGDESIMAALFINRTTFPLSLTEFDREEFHNHCRKLR